MRGNSVVSVLSSAVVLFVVACGHAPTGPVDQRPPAVVELTVLASADSAIISWSTDVRARSIVEYGASVEYGRMTADTTLLFYHTSVLHRLTPATVHYFSIEVTGANGLSNTFTGDFQTIIKPTAEPVVRIAGR